MPRKTFAVAARAAVTMATTVLVSACSLQPDVSANAPPVSRTEQPAPALRGTSLSGATVDLASLRGHPVVVDFWASWCSPCRLEQADVNALASTYAARGVRFLGVDIRDDSANALAYVQRYHVTYPSVFDPASDAAAAFDVLSPPTTLVVDATGTIRLRELGTVADVPALLDSLLAKG